MWLLNILKWLLMAMVIVVVVAFVVVDLLITATLALIFVAGGLIFWLCIFVCGLFSKSEKQK